MATMKKAQPGALLRKGVKAVTEKAVPKSFKLDTDILKNVIKKNERETLKEKMRGWDKKMDKKKNGGSLGMKSVKAGYDNNPGVTRADIITAAKGKAKSGATLKKQGSKIKKAQDGGDIPGLAERAGPMVKTKTKVSSPDGNYVTKKVTTNKPNSKNSTTKTRRTLQGFITGAPRVNDLKNGGKMAKCKYGCK